VGDGDAERYDIMIAYAIVYRFLGLLYDRPGYAADNDIIQLRSWGELNADGTQSHDPAYIPDWHDAAQGRQRLTIDETYAAMLRFFEGYASRGCSGTVLLPLIERLRNDPSKEAATWHRARALVSEDVAAGEPYRGAFFPD
jgi:hypothetical protein